MFGQSLNPVLPEVSKKSSTLVPIVTSCVSGSRARINSEWLVSGCHSNSRTHALVLPPKLLGDSSHNRRDAHSLQL